MTQIRMELPTVQDLARSLDQQADSLASHVSLLQMTTRRLSSAWQGKGSDSFNDRLGKISRDLEIQSEKLQILASRVNQEADEWISKDQLGQQTFQPLHNSIQTGLINTPDELGKKLTFDWEEIIQKPADYISIIDDLSELNIIELTDVGRIINKLPNVTGWVGKMKWLEQSHLLPAFSFFLGGISAFVRDFLIEKDESFFKAFFSGFTSASMQYVVFEGIKLAAKKFLPKLVPGVGQALVVYELILFAGDIFTGILRSQGKIEQANNLENFLDKIDINTYTDKLADEIADYVKNNSITN